MRIRTDAVAIVAVLLCAVVVAGEVLYRDGVFTRFDERELLREVRVTLQPAGC